MTPETSGALVGLVGAVGVLLLLSWRSARRPPNVGQRIAAYVPASSLRGRPDDPGAAAWKALVLLLRPGSSHPGASRPQGHPTLERRLAAAGMRASVEEYRLERVVWCGLGAGLGLALGAWSVAGGSSPLVAVVLAVVGGVGGWIARDRRLGQQSARRRERIERQLPTLAELLAFAVVAGESPMAALERSTACLEGDLPDEVQRAIARIRSGVPLESSLRSMADRAGSPALQRFVEGLAVALERGTPLADVMRAQAADARAVEQRHLMELAGRKDVGMLVPVVFLILPTVVLIALFPGISGLRLIVP